jgi:flagellar protein FliO/FliZ
VFASYPVFALQEDLRSEDLTSQKTSAKRAVGAYKLFHSPKNDSSTINKTSTGIFPANDERSNIPLKENNLLGLIARTIMALGVIILIIFGIFRFLFKGQRWMGKNSELMQVLATIPLGSNKYIQMVEMLDRILVLGISDSSINLLLEITDKDTIDLIKTQKSKEFSESGVGFSTQLAGLLKKFQVESQIKSQADDFEKKMEFLKKQRERLLNLDVNKKEQASEG